MISKCWLWIAVALPAFATLTYNPGGASCSSHPCTAIVTCPTSTCASTDINTAVTGGQIQLGDTITIQHGIVWTFTATTTLPYVTIGSGVITIRTDVSDSQLPASTTRITPAYTALMPTLQLNSSGSTKIFEVEQTANPTGNYTFIGLNFTSGQGYEPTTLLSFWVPPASDGCQITNITDVSKTTPMVVTYTGGTSGCFDDGSYALIEGIYGAYISPANSWWKISNPTHSTTQATLLHWDGSDSVPTGAWHAPWDNTFTYNTGDGTTSTCSGSKRYYLSTADSNLNNSPCTADWCQIGAAGCGQAQGILGLDSTMVMQSTVNHLNTTSPTNITIDRCILQGHPLGSVTKGARFVANNVTVKNSFCDNIKAQNDSQCWTFLGGPHTFTNNWVGGGPGEHTISGGLTPNITLNDAGVDPGPAFDVTINYNAYYDDPAKYKYENWQQNAWVEAGKVINGNPYFNPVAAASYSLSAGSTIKSTQGTTSVIACNATLTSTPTIETGTFDGQLLFIINRSSSCVLQDNGTLVGSKLSLTTPPTVTIAANQGLEFQWSAGSGLWVQVGTVTASGSASNQIAMTSGTTGSSLPTFSGSNCASQFVCAGGCCVTDGTVTWTHNPLGNPKWTMKNSMEFKLLNVHSMPYNIVEYNVLDGAWYDGQSGFGLSFKANEQGITGTGRTKYLEFRYNVVRNASTLATISSNNDTNYGEACCLHIHDNFFQPNSLIGLNYGGTATIGSKARADTSYNFTPPYFADFIVNHNTLDRATDATGTFWSIGQCPSATGNGSFDGLSINYNLFHMQGTTLPLIAPCPGTTQKAAALSAVTNGVSSYNFTGNNVDNGALTNWPANNYNSQWAALKFANITGGNPWLIHGSPAIGVGDSGSNLGADTRQLPQIRNLSVATTDKQALLSWNLTAGNQSVPCVVEVSTTRDFSSYIADLDPAVYTRPESTDNDWLAHTLVATNLYGRSILIGKNVPLTASTLYWYRLHCGGDFSIGNYTTQAAQTVHTTTFSISKRQKTSGTTGIKVTWGYAYSRASGAINSGGVVTASCSLGQLCTANLTVDTGRLLYYQIQDMNGSTPVSTYSVLERLL